MEVLTLSIVSFCALFIIHRRITKEYLEIVRKMRNWSMTTIYMELDSVVEYFRESHNTDMENIYIKYERVSSDRSCVRWITIIIGLFTIYQGLTIASL